MDRNKVTIEAFDHIASAYQDKFMGLNLYDDTYDAFCQLIGKPNARVFEIGCGPGNMTRYILAKRPDFAVKAIDLSPNMIRLAQANNPTASFEVMDCREIDKLDDQFDAIMSGFCLPYLSKADCAKLIRDCAALLCGDGIFYCSTIAGDYQQSGYETGSSGQNKMYVYYHQEDYLRGELGRNGFELVDLIRKSYPKPDGTSATHLIYIARRK